MAKQNLSQPNDKSNRIKHGLSGTQIYITWANMISRCQNYKNEDFCNYGGRGITVCNRWKKFENFYADMGPRPSSKHSIDRIDNSGNYEPRNCRWATPKDQARNRRSNRLVLVDGRLITIAEAANIACISLALLHYRLKSGWSTQRALSRAKPYRPRRS
jgi:hypothetical protein